MRIVALETTERTGSVAAFDDERLLEEFKLPPHQRSAQSLLPGIDRLLRQVGWDPGDIGLVTVANGPGSFTGLRIGVTAAKTLAFVVRAELVAVNTLHAIATRAGQRNRSMWTILDAQRGQLFTSQFRMTDDGQPQEVQPTRVEGVDTWLQHLEQGEVVTGPALSKVASQIPPGVTVCSESVWRPTAAAVGEVGWKQFQAGHRDDLWRLVPNYFRLSAAEEKERGQ
ncbi:MAG: tRNA (adenosine(37)-N6)-threonylcarbamoyltransferase complex dimerization subunit type 1 TsaB [Pirellulales bacterium]